jgi:hypothetical protein
MTRRSPYLINSNLTVVAAILLGGALAIGGVSTVFYVDQASAQMMRSNMPNLMAGGGYGIQNPNIGFMMTGNPAAANISGSVPIISAISKAIASQAHVSLVNATTTAEKTIGGNSMHALSAHLGIQNGFLVYTVSVIDASNNFHNIIVDAGNGKVLLNQQIKPGMFTLQGPELSTTMGPPPGASMAFPVPYQVAPSGGGMMFGSPPLPPAAAVPIH